MPPSFDQLFGLIVSIGLPHYGDGNGDEKATNRGSKYLLSKRRPIARNRRNVRLLAPIIPKCWRGWRADRRFTRRNSRRKIRSFQRRLIVPIRKLSLLVCRVCGTSLLEHPFV